MHKKELPVSSWGQLVAIPHVLVTLLCVVPCHFYASSLTHGDGWACLTRICLPICCRNPQAGTCPPKADPDMPGLLVCQPLWRILECAYLLKWCAGAAGGGAFSVAMPGLEHTGQLLKFTLPIAAACQGPPISGCCLLGDHPTCREVGLQPHSLQRLSPVVRDQYIGKSPT